MNATVVMHIQNMENFEEHHCREDFEYDLRESARNLLVHMGVDFEDLEFQFGYNGYLDHEAADE